MVDRLFDADLPEFWPGLCRPFTVEADVRYLPEVVAHPIQYVVHAAAVTASPEEAGVEPETQFLEAVETVATCLRWVRHDGVGRAPLLSSGAVVAGANVSVRSELTQASPTTVYAGAKWSVELLREVMREHYGCDVLAIRLGNVYGPGERTRDTRPRTSLVHAAIARAIDWRSVPFPETGVVSDRTYAPDVGDAIASILLASSAERCLYHFSSGEVLSALEISRAIAIAFGRCRSSNVGGGGQDEQSRVARYSCRTAS